MALGIWVGVLSQFIPVIGTYLAAILPALVALSATDITTTLWVVVYFIAYQQVENFLIAPRITKRTMEIHPAISIAAIIIGGGLARRYRDHPRPAHGRDNPGPDL